MLDRQPRWPAALARGADSRITTNFQTEWQNPEPGKWVTLAYWDDFLTVDGLEILPFHGDTPDHNPRLPIRDVLHVRPGALERARDALTTFVQGLLRRQP